MNNRSSLNKTILIIAALAPVLMSSECGLPKYGAANFGSESTYLAKPIYRDTSENANYLSAKFYHSIDNTAYYEREKIYFGELRFHRSHTSKYYNLSYGALAFGGSYRVNEVQQYKGNKYLAGGGLTAEFNGNLPFSKVDWRIIGIRLTALYENGRYASFRDDAERDSLIINVHPHRTTFNISVSTDVIIKLKKVDFGYYYSMGGTFGDEENFLTFTHCLHFTQRRLTYFAQSTTAFFGPGTTISGGLSYQFGRARQPGRIRKTS